MWDIKWVLTQVFALLSLLHWDSVVKDASICLLAMQDPVTEHAAAVVQKLSTVYIPVVVVASGCGAFVHTRSTSPVPVTAAGVMRTQVPRAKHSALVKMRWEGNGVPLAVSVIFAESGALY